MRTVKEISDLTGISVRTLHYYDEIGLLKPTAKSEAGYRLYDDKALETLQQILFFREFDVSLKEIKAVMEDPDFDRNRILQLQRDMLAAQKERLERLIAGIDEILKGENKVDFAIFERTKVEEMFRLTYNRMQENMRRLAIDEFGSVEKWKKHFVDAVSSEKMRKIYAKVTEWYGHVETIFQKLAEKRNCPPDSFEVKQLIGEYGFVMKQITHVQDETGLMRYLAWFQSAEPTKSKMDNQYGVGTAEFMKRAMEAVYGKMDMERL